MVVSPVEPSVGPFVAVPTVGEPIAASSAAAVSSVVGEPFAAEISVDGSAVAGPGAAEASGVGPSADALSAAASAVTVKLLLSGDGPMSAGRSHVLLRDWVCAQLASGGSGPLLDKNCLRSTGQVAFDFVRA